MQIVHEKIYNLHWLNEKKNRKLIKHGHSMCC